MKKCEKFGIKCPYWVENKESHCVADSKECENRRSAPLVFPKDCETELPDRWDSWFSLYDDYLTSLPKGTDETLFFEFYEGDNEFIKKKLFVPYIVMMTCNEAFEQILKEEMYEGMSFTKKILTGALKKTRGLHASVIENAPVITK